MEEMFDIEKLKSELPELPQAKRSRYKSEYGIKDEDIESYVVDIELGSWFEEVAKELKDKGKIKIASNYITSDYIGIKKSNEKANLPSILNFTELINMLADGQISSRTAKDILSIIVIEDSSPMKIATEKDLIQKNDEGALKEIVQKVIDANPQVIATYKGGKEKLLGWFVGQTMRASQGKANPAMLNELVKKKLDA